MTRSRLGAALLVAIVCGATVASAPPAVRAADAPDANIPGVPLPGPVVTGTLGGPIYDRVYRLSVPAGNVIVASMTGSPGTDFDMYLFDSTATTVYANPPVGLMTWSKGPGSTESISYPSRRGGTYYLDLNGVTDVVGDFTLSVSILADGVPPTVTVRIEGGAPAVNHQTVILTVVAQDELSGVDAMALSSDGAEWQPWQSYAPAVSWTFPAGDGSKQVWVRVRDRAGNISASAQASTVLDTTPPVVISVAPAPGAVVGDLRPPVRVVFSKPMTPVWWNTGGLVLRLAAGGDPVPGTFAYEDASRTGTFIPSVDLAAGVLYQAQLTTLYDVAQNPLVPYPAWAFTAKPTLGLAVTVTPGTITSGASAVVTGTAVLPTRAAVEIQQRPTGTESWTTIAAPFPDAAGGVRVSVAPRSNVAYRLRVSESPSTAESFSPAAPLLVRTRITLGGLTPSRTYAARAGAVQPLLAQISPPEGRVAVTFQMFKWDAAKRVWRLFVKTTRNTTAAGLATWSWTQRPGSWQLKVVAAATPDNMAGISGLYRWTVK